MGSRSGQLETGMPDKQAGRVSRTRNKVYKQSFAVAEALVTPMIDSQPCHSYFELEPCIGRPHLDLRIEKTND